MSESTNEYEFARKIIKRERKNPNPYTDNRKEALIQRVHQKFGEKGAKEFLKEFKKDYGWK